MMKRISVCMATYNGAPYIFDQLHTILKQLRAEDEIIISDDISTDKTLTIIEQFNDSRIRLFPNKQRLGVVKNFENALKHAQGQYIFLADQDDLWELDRVDTVLQYLQQYDLINTDCSIIDSSGHLICDSYFEFKNSGKGLFKNFYKNTYFGCCMAFRRELLKVALPIPKSVCMHDVWIGLLAEIYGKVFFLKKPLIKYRRHGNNASFAGEVSKNSFIKKISLRISLLYCLVLRLLKIA